MEILIVEDEPRLAESVRILLENRNLGATVAATGNEAVDILRARAFDLVLLDLVLPGYDGGRVLELAVAKYPETPVIVLTGMASVEAAVACLKRGAFDFLKKPFDPDELTNRVERALEHKTLHEHRRSWEEAYRILIEHSVQGVLVFGGDRMLFVNPAAAEIFGYRPEEILSMAPERIRGGVHPDDREMIFGKAERLLGGEGPDPRAEIRVYRRDGSLRWLECHANTIAFGGAPALQVAFLDITDRKKMEAEIVEAKEYADSIIQSSIDMIIVVDDERRIREFNSAAEECFGYGRAEMLGRDISFLYADSEASDRVAAAVRERGSFTGEIVNRRRDGTLFSSFLSAALLKDRSGTVMGVVGTSRDITEQKQLEESLRRSLSEKEVLLRELHHRVKNNMQLISSFLNIQKRRVTDPEARQAFDDSRSRIGAMSVIHNTLHHAGDLSEINLAGFIGRLVEHLRGLFSERTRIRIQTEIEPLSIGIDQAVAVGLVVNELVSNAFKHAFTAFSGGTILISASKLDGNKVRLVVRDDGRGGRFPDADASCGHSLGLHIVRNLVEQQLRGTWRVETESGTAHTIDFEQE